MLEPWQVGYVSIVAPYTARTRIGSGPASPALP